MGPGLALGKKEEGEKVSDLRDEVPTGSNGKGGSPLPRAPRSCQGGRALRAPSERALLTS